MNTTREALQMLRGQSDTQSYWDESGREQVRSAGVFLTAQQQSRIVKQLDRLADRVRRDVPDLESTAAAAFATRVDHHLRVFDNYLATFK